jgi:peroxiredoxin
MRTGHLASAVVALGLLGAAPALALELGEKAPELELTDWVQGDAVTLAGGADKSVFLVEFVSTFKPECERAIQAAAKLQDKYKAKGLVVVLVSTESPDDAKTYLAEHKLSFRMAIDGAHNTTAAYGISWEPYAVVADRAGNVVFTGDPDEGLDKLVDDVIAGKFDLKRSLEVKKLHDELREAQRGGDEEDDGTGGGGFFVNGVRVTMNGGRHGDRKKVDEVCDKILALDAADLWAFDARCEGFRGANELDGYRKFVKAHVDRLKDDPKALSGVAWRLVDDGRTDWRDPDTALAAAKRSAELVKGADADVVDTYARVLANVGLLEQAIAEEKKASAAAPNDEDYKKQAAFWESCLALRQKLLGGKTK